MNNNIKASAMDSVVELSPKIKRARSTFNLNIREYTSFNVGDLCPIGGFTEVLPGDTFNVDLSTFIRLTSPSRRAPMDQLHMDIFAFFVPNRFLDDSWAQIQGENTSAWVAPATSCSTLKFVSGDAIAAGSLLNHLGLPILSAGTLTNVEFNIYPIYAYMKIVNDWFRDENLQADLAFDTTNNVYGISSLPIINSQAINASGSLFKVAKYHDVFTSALPAPLKASANVSIPLGQNAPVVANDSNFHSTVDSIRFGDGVARSNTIATLYASYPSYPASSGILYGDTNGISGSSPTGAINMTNLVADLSNATAASINSLRLAFQLQKAYELDARSGTRYTEAIEARFGTKNPDLRLGRSELLGHYRFDLNMNEEMSTTASGTAVSGTDTDYLIGDSYINGVGAGSSKTGYNQHICVKTFLEHGLFCILGCVRPDLTYQNGIEPYWSKKSRFDFYEPIFSNIGEMPIMKSALYGASIASDSVFGYQEAWYDYRYKMTNNVSGILASDSNTGFDIFHYGMDFNAAPTLSSVFIQQSGVALDRSLAFPSTTVDNFIMQARGVIKATRVMPLFSTPGLIDHF